MKKILLFNLIFLLVLFIQDSRAEDTLRGHTINVESVSFSPGAGTLSDDVLKMEGHYRTWHVPNGVIARLGKGTLRRSNTFSPDGQYLAVVSSIGIWLYDVATSRERALIPTTSSVTSVSFSPDGMLLASGSGDGTVKLWDVSTGQERTTPRRAYVCGLFCVIFT